MKLSDIGIITFLVLLGIMIFSGLFLREQFENPEVVFLEEPLEKNTNLQIMPGETYKYSYLMNNSTANITYRAVSWGGCTKIYIVESLNNTNVCLDEWGMDETGSNSTFQSPAFLLFKPWMLALEDNWRWNNSMYLRYGDITHHVSDNYYRVLRKENYSGRMTYVVEINSTTGALEYQWVDAEKRVLVRVLGEGYEVELAT